MRHDILTRSVLAFTITIAMYGFPKAVEAETISLTRVEGLGFGPPIMDAPSLNANVRTLSEVMAWKNKPGSDAFQLAANVVNDHSFNQVALVSLANTGQNLAVLPPE